MNWEWLFSCTPCCVSDVMLACDVTTRERHTTNAPSLIHSHPDPTLSIVYSKKEQSNDSSSDLKGVIPIRQFTIGRGHSDWALLAQASRILWNSMTSTSFVFTELANTMKFTRAHYIRACRIRPRYQLHLHLLSCNSTFFWFLLWDLSRSESTLILFWDDVISFIILFMFS